MKTIVLCSSGSFYKHVNELADELEGLGFRAVVPATARRMRVSGDYDISKVKTWLNNSKDFDGKATRSTDHFREVAKGDAVLIVNDDKPSQPNYIGPNVLMEWGLAFYLGKPVFILNGVAKDANTYEEVFGLSTAVLDGDLTKIKF